MNCVSVWVARTAVGATVPTALAQATASPLPEIAAGARLDPDIAAQPLSLEGMARGAKIQRAKIQCAKIQCAKIQCAKSASASNTLSVHPITAANDSRIHDTNSSVPMPPRVGH
jgi:hypothetical protein